MSKEIEFLKKLQREMNEGEIDCQAFPRYWVLKDYRNERCFPEDAESTHFYMGTEKLYTKEEVLEELENDKDSFRDEDWEMLDDSVKNNDESLVEWIKDNLYVGAELYHTREVGYIVPGTLFLTKKEAQEHLKLYAYNYSEKAHTYAMTAHRAPNVEKLFEILEKFNWDTL